MTDMKQVFVVFFTLLISHVFGQNDLPIGSWETYLPYREGNIVTQSDTKVYYATQLSIFTIDKTTNEVEFYDKTDGLTEVGINALVFDQNTQSLVIVYENSSIDIIKDDIVYNLPNIKNNTTIQGDKTIHRARVYDGNLYLCAGFGLVQIDLKTRTFGFTSVQNFAVRDIAIYENQYFVATDGGLYSIPQNSNPADFSIWRYWDQLTGIPINFKPFSLGKLGGGLLVGGDNSLYIFEGDRFTVFKNFAGRYVKFINSEKPKVLVGWSCRPNYCDGTVEVYNADRSFVGNQGWDCVKTCDYALIDESSRIWYADQGKGYRVENTLGEGCHPKVFNSPRTFYSTDIESIGKNLYIAAGGVDNSESYLFREDGLIYREDGTWKELNKYTNQAIADQDIRDFYQVEKKPRTNKLYIGTYYEGIIEKDGDNITLYNTHNSSLQGTQGDTQRVRISGLAFDKNNNLWIANFFGSRPISVLKDKGGWKNFGGIGLTALSQVVVDNNNFKWFVVRGVNGGILLFDEGKNIDDESDDRYRLINTSNSILPTQYVNCLAVDLEGDVWAGTTEGIAIFECGSGAFNSECKGTERIISQNGIGAILLKEQNIKCIAIDGANRKWIGTTNGVFVQSPSGEDPIHHFTASNSPLLDDVISTIHISDSDGTVYIGTSKGVCSYRGEASLGVSELKKETVFAFPNPVRPEYSGLVAIKGLTRDANVKITDINGELVFETAALGGQALWDTTDFSGRKVSSGVYLVFCTDTSSVDEAPSMVTKIAIVR